MDWYMMVLKKYAVFSGRSRRKEYWMYFLITVLIAVGLMIIDFVAGIGFLNPIYSLAVLIPGLAVAIRRLHDIDKSGWWILISLVPLVGGIWLIVLLCTEGTRGSNRFGDDPKAGGALAAAA